MCSAFSRYNLSHQDLNNIIIIVIVTIIVMYLLNDKSTEYSQ